jgi:hypothetical protein
MSPLKSGLCLPYIKQRINETKELQSNNNTYLPATLISGDISAMRTILAGKFLV